MFGEEILRVGHAHSHRHVEGEPEHARDEEADRGRRREKGDESDKREERIARFVDDYVDHARRHITAGLPALVPTGVTRLNDDSEIRAALDMCRTQLGKHPLGGNKDDLKGVDLKVFFEFAAEKQVNFSTTSVEQALAMLKEQGHR